MKDETFLKFSVMVEDQWRIYARDVLLIDVSQFPYREEIIPELGITHRITFYPDHLKPQFQAWLRDIYLPPFTKPEAAGKENASPCASTHKLAE